MRISGLSILMIILTIACKEKTRFQLLPSEQTGIDFVNEITPTTDLNIFNYLYFYNGGGVAAGDLNGDLLPDLYFVSNQGQSQLYLNQGDFKFLDISEVLNRKDRNSQWCTGVTFADVNGDGLMDIYAQEVGSHLKVYGQNKLYINQGNDENGIPQFKEMAKKYGLDLVGYCTQAAFLDYDLDGDLDMYQLNHSIHAHGTFTKSDLRYEKHPLAGDRFLRNDGDYFKDVTDSCGIYSSPLGYGLGIAVSDINEDGYPDLYIGNDFHENDYFYINQKDGTFKDQLGDMMGHTSRFSMGNDIGDINNDGAMDVLSLDMLPRDYAEQKSSEGEDNFDVFRYKLSYGYNYQYARNTLQLNRGNGKFSDIAFYSDVQATDWSWAGLLADFDLNGFNDLYVANGIKNRINDSDYIKFIANEAISQKLEKNVTNEDLKLSEKIPEVLIPNYVFQNLGGIQFSDVSAEWGLNQPSYSNGCAYVDLDLDGDLDLVVNNINQRAFIYKNNTLEKEPYRHFVGFRFEGNDRNKFGIGCKVQIELSDGNVLTRENFITRGFESSVEPVLHFGLDTFQTISKVKVIWPGSGTKEYSNLKSDQIYKVNQEDMINLQDQLTGQRPVVLMDEAHEMGVDFLHRENDYIDFKREGLIPQSVSMEGPAFARADFNGDGKEDFFVGGAKWQYSQVFIQNEMGGFGSLRFEEDSTFEHVDAIARDFNGDGTEDLLILSGGNEFRGPSPYRSPRLYLNDGQAHFTLDTEAFEEVYLTGSSIAAADYDNDGDMDLFLGARAEPWAYGISPQSYFLLNENGRFSVDERFDELSFLGMVTKAQWADMDQNGMQDLVVATEWGSIKIIYQYSDEMKIVKLDQGLWCGLQLDDVDGDGDIDIIAGNLGLNSKIKADDENPLHLYIKDFDGNDQVEQIITYERGNREYLFAERDDVVGALPYLKKKFPDYTSFAKADFHELFSEKELSEATILKVSELRSCVFYNNEGHFEKIPFPAKAQWSPQYSFQLFDLGNDEKRILSVGNFRGATVERGKYDASYGDLISVKGVRISYIENQEHGLYLSGDMRKVAQLNVDGEDFVVVLRNNGPLSIYKFKPSLNPAL
ncbi:VCBS repeat-containing protein [Marinoscillum sp. MHG1-6]|uniref:VCBS repeat-containing protein n=1 Tax=Marinoscillum sp. MHG1-6 TaxID=2959627 RepID=UPI00215841DD|nr:VCBS repeat-containing protein [Marinoscillum sp. MHG1-6]